MQTKKPLETGILNDYYGSLLTEYQSELVAKYFDEDLSLAELAAHYGISRQGVRDVIVRSEQKLRDCEAKLGLVSKLYGIENKLQEVIAAEDCPQTVKDRLIKILQEVKEI